MLEVMIRKFLNTNKDAEDLLDDLFRLYSIDGRIDIEKSKVYLEELISAGYRLGNIKNLTSYKKHCLVVSETSDILAKKILNHYPRLDMKPNKAAYFGLVEDYSRCIANEEGQEIHEILSYIDLTNRELFDIRDATELHFVGPEELMLLQKRGRFLDLKYSQERQEKNIYYAIVSGADILCTTEFLGKEDMMKGFEKRIRDFKKRHRKDHILMEAFYNDGEKRLRKMINKLDKLCRGEYSKQQVGRVYNLTNTFL